MSLRLSLSFLALTALSTPLLPAQADAAEIRRGSGNGVCSYGKCWCPPGYSRGIALFAPGEDPNGATLASTIEVGGLSVDGEAQGSNARVRFHGVVTPGFGPYLVTLELGGAPVELLIPAPEPFDDGSDVGVSGDLGVKARFVVTDDVGGVKLAIFNSDAGWDPTLLGAVTLSDGLGDVPLEQGTTRVRFDSDADTSDLPSCDAAGGELAVLTETLLDSTGAVLDGVLDGGLMGEPSPTEPSIETLRLSTTSQGNAKLVATTRGTDRPGSMSFSLVDDATSETLLATSQSAPASIERQFAFTTLTFEDPTAARGETYTLVLDFRDAAGMSLGATEASVEIALTDSVNFTAPAQVDLAGTAVSYALALLPTSETDFELAVTVLSGEVASVDAFFADYSGPSPIPTEAQLPLVEEWQKWVAKGTAGSGTLDAGGTGTSVVVVSNNAGETRGVAGGSDGKGLQYSNGKGTKNTSSKASTKPELL